LNSKFAVFIASWFGSGFIPPILLKGMAGTYGSFFSLPLCWALLYFGQDSSPLWYGIAFVVIFFLGLATVRPAELAIGPRTDWKGKTKDRDQNQIVIDETFGMLYACSPLCFYEVNHLFWALFLAFVLFRFFDIVKVPPTRFFDRMKNPVGVMMDDAVAGVYAALVLMIIIKIWQI